MKLKSFSVVKTVINNASERFSPEYRLCEDRFEILEDYCKGFDSMIDGLDCTEFSCDVNEEDMTVCVMIAVDTIAEENPRSGFLQQLIARSLRFSIENTDGENIRLSFVFPSLWEPA